MSKLEKIGHVKGLGDIYRSYAPFPEQIRDFNELGIKLVSVRDASYERLHGDNIEGTRTCHAPVCAKDSPTIIVRMSPLIKDLEMAEQAVNAHRDNQYPVFDKDKSIYAKYEEIAKEDENKMPEKRRAIILPKREDYGIHKDSDEAMFFFQDTRKDYFKRFVPKDIVPCWQISTDKVDSTNGTIINYVWFGEPDVRSGLLFWDRDLLINLRALEVLRKSGEATSQKIPKALKLDEIVQAALKQRKAFEYKGVLYVPVRGKSVSLNQ